MHQRDETFRPRAIERRHLENVGAADEGLLARAGEHHGAQILARRQRLDRPDELDSTGVVGRVFRPKHD